jgi:hypothetical protein
MGFSGAGGQRDEIELKPADTVRFACGATVLVVGLTGCTATGPTPNPPLSTPSTTASSTPTSAAAPDFKKLLIEPGDISDTSDTFAIRSTTVNPDGRHGVNAFFVNQDDTRAISVTILILPDPAAASTALNATVDSIGTAVIGGEPEPAPVGTDGCVVSGTAPDGSKALTVLLFTEGRAVVRLEFGSAAGDPTSAQFVTDVGQKQQIAIRTGLLPT